FKEERNGAYKMIGTYAKTARGRMAKYLLQQKIDTRAGIQGFAEDGYAFNPALSGSNTFIFTRNNNSTS
ncbi:peroxide stress protein YaaA, partial [Flavobacteriales bacterium]|nr:peroxide stress protein YaaA [Flavobacteriales bacterium]